MSHPVSPLAPKRMPAPKPVKGMRLAMVASNLRYKNRDDLLLVHFPDGAAVAGCFTQSLTAAAPVGWCRSIVKKGRADALLVNAGNANAATGKHGQAIVEASCQGVSAAVKCPKNNVFIASTGIIGMPLPVQAIPNFVPELAAGCAVATAKNIQQAARAIMTTDTFPKWASATARINGKTVTVTGIAKGSGMIAPNMATLLSFVFTDALIDPKILQQMVTAATNKSFNAITVDGDTSTNDTFLAFATGKAGHKKITQATGADAKNFAAALDDVMMELAQLVVRDGEGAQKLITIDVSGADSQKAARVLALTIANSPLVKTAIAGADANWGRILGAAGRAGEKINSQKLKVTIGGVVICKNTQQVKNYNEAPVVKHMKTQNIHIAVDVGVKAGKAAGAARVWTCDLTHGYIDINGSYRS